MSRLFFRKPNYFSGYLSKHIIKNPDHSVEALCWRYLSSWVGQVLYCRLETCRWHVLGRNRYMYEKTALFRVRSMLALPIFPGRHQPSIVGANELNFCVRDGNRWTLIAINTNFSGYTLKTEHQFIIFCILLKDFTESALWSSFRLISISQLHALLHFHL